MRSGEVDGDWEGEADETLEDELRELVLFVLAFNEACGEGVDEWAERATGSDRWRRSAKRFFFGRVSATCLAASHSWLFKPSPSTAIGFADSSSMPRPCGCATLCQILDMRSREPLRGESRDCDLE
jgi:hypothetical protein